MNHSHDPHKRRRSLARALADFIHEESAGGIIMIGCTVLALALANSHLSEWYLSTTRPAEHFVKDVLMVLFFFSVGMELKREMVEGLLSQKGQVMMPLIAAIGGMAVPALIYVALNHSDPVTAHGWAIPSATDIAFALAILLLFGKSAPASAKILLLAIAIFDDLGAILIIAFFYNSQVAVLPLALTILGGGILFLLNKKQVSALWPYLAMLVYLWFCLHASGIHTTIAGVAVGLAIPLRDKQNSENSPLGKALHFLHPWVAFGVLPIFAFTSAGVSLEGVEVKEFFAPMPLGIALGLFFGKQIGIFGSIFMLVKLRLAPRPEGMNWLHVYAVSLLAGIGFTMSLFIALLAFSEPHLQDIAKIGIISGSLLSTVFGGLVLYFSPKR